MLKNGFPRIIYLLLLNKKWKRSREWNINARIVATHYTFEGCEKTGGFVIMAINLKRKKLWIFRNFQYFSGLSNPHKFPRLSCSASKASKSALKFPAPKPWNCRRKVDITKQLGQPRSSFHAKVNNCTRKTEGKLVGPECAELDRCILAS